MEPYVIVETEEDRKQERARAANNILPIARGCFISVPLVFITNQLMNTWGAQMPSLMWATPLITLLCFFSLLAVVTFIPTEIIFTDRSLKVRGFQSYTIKWNSVRSWSIEINNGRILATFKLRLYRTIRVWFPQSAGIDNIKKLVRQYGKL